MLDPFGLSPQISWSDIGHGVLDLLGMIPGVGALADLANGFWYMSEGDYFSAASSFVSSVPGLGDIAGGIAKAVTGCTKYAKAFKFATRVASNIGNFALGAYQTATQIGNLWDKYVTQGKPWGEESLGEFLGATFTGISTVFSAKGVADDIVNYKNTKHDILTSQCFVEGTLVVTKDGDKPIEEIKAGDLVYSTDPETGESEYKEVVRTFRKETDVLIHIFVNDDEIETTPVHPFWVDGEWVAAKDLREGDELTLADGSTAIITKTYGEQLDEPVIVYNFEVSDFHTYYVTDNGVLVHNANKINDCGVGNDVLALPAPGETSVPARRAAAEKKLSDAAMGSGGSGLTDFIGTEYGVSIHADQKEMVNSITSAGAVKVSNTSRTSEMGEIYKLGTPYGDMEIRVMPGQPGNTKTYKGPRTINIAFGSAGNGGHGRYVYADGRPITGTLSKSQRAAIGHIHGQR